MKLFTTGWTFLKTSLGATYDDIKDIKSQFEPVEIPHDWLIYDTNNLYEDSCGFYLKRFDLSELSENESGHMRGNNYRLIFDGVYMDCSVYCNNVHLGDWKYGYSSFSFELTDFLKEKDNELVVLVRHQAPNSRWYSGAGIFRDVWTHQFGNLFIENDGVYVHTTKETDGYILRAEVEIGNKNEILPEAAVCKASLWEGDKQVFDLGCVEVSDGGVVFEESLKGVNEWSTTSPHCYELKINIFDRSGNVLDKTSLTVGFKDLRFDHNQGLFLNGKHIKLNGVCEHHDFGCLGSAFHIEAARYRFEKLKKMGVNALRTSHNMAARQLLELCDRMGILVIAESFDMWEKSKTTYDYSRFFKEWAAKDVASWVRRDRNHPCLLMWSIGNEIYDTHADSHGEEITRRLLGFVREHDPLCNANVTIGSNYMPWEGAKNCADIIKFAGYNYAEKLYEEHHKEHPDWVIYGSETASTVGSRGIYHFPLSQPILADSDSQCSILGNSTTSWGAKDTETCIISDRDAKFSLGQFIWTGFDYIGEPTPYHTKNSYFGQIDTAGFEKDSYYIYQAEWTDVNVAPMVHVFPYWDFNEGQIIDVRVCSNASTVELFLNGESLGKRNIDHINGAHVVCNWQVAFVPGILKAVAYDDAGNIIAEDMKESFTEAERIVVKANKDTVLADGEDLCFVEISAVDENGKAVWNATDYVKVAVTGGHILGMDNGDSTDYEQYKCNARKLFSGKCMAVIEPDGTADKLVVNVTSPTLKSSLAEISVDRKVTPKRGKDLFVRKLDNVDVEKKPVPVRNISITVSNSLLTKEQPFATVKAEIKPSNATDKNIIYEVVTKAGIPCPYAKAVTDNDTVTVNALGDGEFYLRCLSKSSTDSVRLISQLDMKAEGIGSILLNPYEFISAGLKSEIYGEVGNGNERGVATARGAYSGIKVSNIDFGEFGSDEITLWIFGLSSDAYPFEIWDGEKLIFNGIYKKPSIWNTYQEETYKLPVRLSGVHDIKLFFNDKVHIKGFEFAKQEKAFAVLDAALCDDVYGDSFTVEKKAITGIGNNVTITFNNMHFGETADRNITIKSKSSYAKNTVHIRFVRDKEVIKTVAVDIAGHSDYSEDTFNLGEVGGDCSVEFVFLPGSNIDFGSFVIF